MPPKTRKGSSKGGRGTSTAQTTATNTLRVTRRGASANAESRVVVGGGGGGLEQQSFLSQYSQLGDGDTENSCRIYFILPRGTTEATCDQTLTSAYTSCRDSKLRCSWMSEEQCRKFQPQEYNIFVLAPFDGPAFVHLEDCRRDSPNFEIIGPQCIKYALQASEDCPIVNRGCAPYTMSMRNILVTLTGIPEAEKQILATKIQRMNGAVSPVFSHGVTHVVAGDILSVKCTVAYGNGIPVMKTQWVEAVWENSQVDLLHATDPKYVNYACPLFHNLVICISQVSLDMKTALRNAIESNGGKYTAELVRNKTDVLVVPKDGGEKFRYAQQWKLPCVTPDWVESSKSAGHVLPLKDFEVKELVVSTSTPQNSMVLPLEFQDMSEISNINPNFRKDVTLMKCKNDSELSSEDLNILKSATGPYLDGCRVYISGSHNKSEKLRKLLSASAAICLGRLNEQVTHFLVTEKKIPEAELEILKHLDPRPHIVTVEWLLESAKNGNLADEDLFSFNISSSKLAAPKGTKGETSKDAEKTSNRTEISDLVEKKSNELKERYPSQLNDGPEDLAQVNETSTGSVVPSFTYVAPAEFQDLEFAEPVQQLREISLPLNENNRRPNPIVTNVQDTTPNGTSEDDGTQEPTESGNSLESESIYPFTGTRIKIMIDDPEEKIEVQNLIDGGNGEIVEDDFSIIILPPIYSSKLPIDSSVHCFTKHWLGDCLEENTINATESFCHKPLAAFGGMNVILKDVVVAISQYSNPEKEYLSCLISSMGGIYQDVFAKKSVRATTKRTTHLICPVTDNEKYRAAKKWGTPVVVAEWILDCFSKKKCVDVTSFNPELINNSDSTISYLPRTPKDGHRKPNLKPNRNGTGSIISNFLPSVKKKLNTSSKTQPTANTVKQFKIPADPVPGDGGEAVASTLDESFLAWKAAGGMAKYEGIPIPIPKASDSFYEWQANRRKQGIGLPEGDESFVMEGMTKEETRAFRDALEYAGSNSPMSAGINVQRRHLTPKSVMMQRTWEKLMEKYPHPDPVTSTPKSSVLEIRNIDVSNSAESSIGSERKTGADDNLRMRASYKRSSDSSLEDEVVGPVKMLKKMRFSSSDSDHEEPNHSNEVQENSLNSHDSHISSPSKETSDETGPGFKSIFKNVVVWIAKDCPEYESLWDIVERGDGRLVKDAMDASVTHLVIEKENSDVLNLKASLRRSSVHVVRPSWIFACENELTIADEKLHKPITNVASSKSSMQALNSLLADGDDSDGENRNGIGNAPYFAVSKKKQSDNRSRSQERINPEELDAPQVIWVANEEEEKEAKGEEASNRIKDANKKCSNNMRSTRSGSSTGDENKPSTSTIQTKTRERKSKVSSDNIQNDARGAQIPRAEGTKKPNSFPVEVPRNAIFMLSGITEEDKAAAIATITTCGGRISKCNSYDSEAFGIVAGSLARSEKVLGCVAAGKCLLKLAYLSQCEKEHRLVPLTEDVIWKEEDGSAETEKSIAKAAYMWFTRALKNVDDKPMKNLKFYLIERLPIKRAAYSRLILAAGGQVMSASEGADYILTDGKTGSTSEFDPNIVKHPLFLNTIILHDRFD